MKPGKTEKFIPQNVRTLLLAEIFTAYREINELKKKSCAPEISQTILDIRRGLDQMLIRLSPLGAQSEQDWNQLRLG